MVGGQIYVFDVVAGIVFRLVDWVQRVVVFGGSAEVVVVVDVDCVIWFDRCVVWVVV